MSNFPDDLEEEDKEEDLGSVRTVWFDDEEDDVEDNGLELTWPDW
jgi:hypothetical protein